jgi:hypothetical protein
VPAGGLGSRTNASVGHSCQECGLALTPSQCRRRAKYCRPTCRVAAHRRQRDGSPAFRAFTDRMRDRLALGEARYGNTTFAKSPLEIAAEIEPEIVDAAAYCFMLWSRVERLRTRIHSDTKTTIPKEEPS